MMRRQRWSSPPAAGWEDAVSGRRTEEMALNGRELYVHYAGGMADTKLRISAAAVGTARNMNTVAKLVALTTA